MADRERVLAALCDTFVPGEGELPPATALGIPRLLRSEVAALGRPSFVAQLDLLLRLMDSRLANLVLGGGPRRFTDLSPADRERYLRRWAASPIPLKRTAFEDLKRLVLLYAYGTDGPYQRLTGYIPPAPDPASPSAVHVRTPKAGETIEADACVIGSGAGGGVAAAVLAAVGRQVVVLERAAFVAEDRFGGPELAGIAALFVDRGLAATDDRAISVRAGSAVGGGTVVNWSTSLRLPAPIAEEWARSGVDGLDEHYDAVEAACDVDADESARNGPNAVLERGLAGRSLQYETIRRNVRGCGDCGPCAVGCRRGAKRSTLATYLADASRDGAVILDRSDARRIVVRDGAVEAVIARVPGGELTVRARTVVLAGGAIHSPAVLLRSGIATDRAGRELRLHPVSVVIGHYDDRLDPWQGVPQSVMSDHFAWLEGTYGFRIEVAPSHPGVMASAYPWWDAPTHRARMADAGHAAPFLAIVRDRDGGRVTIDAHGEPVMRYFPGAFERRLLVRGMVELAATHRAAGATRIATLHTPPLEVAREGDLGSFSAEIERRGVVPNRVLLFSAHQMSSCRIGQGRATSVADPDGQVWGMRGLFVADASAFPSASGVNPMMTIMALARRTAQRIVAATA